MSLKGEEETHVSISFALVYNTFLPLRLDGLPERGREDHGRALGKPVKIGKLCAPPGTPHCARQPVT
ncbi:hypothetical protein KC328_g110 [Hortaea werneckii]|nr:hypothetical protein KC328_g110 [Hortaea werneckii]